MLASHAGAVHDRGHLRHTNAGHDTRRANRPRTHADLHRVSAGSDQSLCRIGGRDVASNHLKTGIRRLRLPNCVDHALAVSVRSVDDQHVDTCLHQRLGTRLPIGTHAERGADTQAAERILDRVRMAIRLQQVFDGDEANQHTAIADHQQLLDAMLVKQLARFTLLDARRHGHELLCHQLRDLLVQVLLEANVAAGEDADGLVALNHRQPRDVVPPHQLEGIVERLPGAHGDGVDDHARLCPLHLGHLERLKLRAHILVQNADPALSGHRHSRAPFGHRVHRARHERDSKLDLPGETRGNVRVCGQKIRVRGQEQHVIEGECFP